MCENMKFISSVDHHGYLTSEQSEWGIPFNTQNIDTFRIRFNKHEQRFEIVNLDLEPLFRGHWSNSCSVYCK